jgi:hypothetical protein
MEEKLEKRKNVLIHPPKYYDVAPCDCGNCNTQWSEFEHHLWCSDCKKDFQPKNFGILDGPMLLRTSGMLGLSFDRVNLETQEIEVFMEGHYLPIIDVTKKPITDLIRFQVFFNDYNNKIEIPGFIQQNKVIFNDMSKMSQDYKYQLLLGFYDGNIKKWNITVSKHQKQLEVHFKNKREELAFYAFVLDNILPQKEIKNVKQKI